MADEMREHLCSYRFDGASFGFSLMARSAADAEERIKALATATYDGELVERVEQVRKRTAKFIQEALQQKD